jgi:ubiquinone/menaquinone biosynthesis C-methylase UbiE
MSEISAHNATIIDQHNRQAPDYARLTGSMAIDRSAKFRQFAGPEASDLVLDVACGPGVLSTGLAPFVAHVTGIDLTPGMLAEAREAQVKLGLENLAWVEGDAADLPFVDGCFSLVVSSAAFHHFERPLDVLGDMARVCRSGGKVVVSDVTPAPDKSTSYDRIERMRDPSHRHAHSVDELRALGRAAGLGEARVETSSTGGIPFDSVLATSHPVDHSREEIRALLEADADSGEDRLGFQAHFADGKLMARYTTSSFLWMKA